MPYIGNQHNVGDHVNNFKVLDDISSHTATFDGSATSVVSAADDTIRIPEHRFIQGQRVTYTNGGGGNIGGLTTGTAYFVSFDTANTIKLATTLANANNNTVINISAVGSGTSHTLNAAFDGVNTKFKVTYSNGKAARFNNATQLNVAINNVVQRPNIHSSTFTEGFAIEDNHKIVFKTAPTVNDVFWGSIIANTIENFDLQDNEVDNFTGDGSTTEFTLSTIPANNESVVVSINGVVQHPSDKNTARSYTLIDSIIQFTAAPALGDGIQVRHIGFAGASTADVSGFYGRTGNVALTSSDHITTGDITSRNINSSGIITATTFSGGFSGNVVGTSATFTGNLSVGGVLTYEDVTNVDSVGIITAQKDIHVGAGLSVVGVTTLTGRILAGGTSIPGYSGADDLTIGSETGHHGITIRSGTDKNGGLFFSDDTVGGSNSNQWAAGIEYNHPGSDLRFYVGNTWRFSFQGVGHYIPYTDSTINIGNSSKRFLNVFADYLNLSSHATISGDLDVDGHTNLDNVSVAGVTTFASNVGIAQSIFHDNDTDTTIGFPAANQIKITAGGEVNTTFTSSTVGFNKKLVLRSSAVIDQEVSESSATVPTLRIRNTANHTLASFQNTNTTSTIIQWNDYGSSTTAGNLIFRSSNGAAYEEHARFTGAGNLNLSKDLDVDGHTELDNVRISGITTVSGEIRKPLGSYHPMLTIRNQSGGSVAMRIDNWSNSASTKRMSITHNFNRISSAFAADDSSIGCASVAFENGEIRFGTSAAGTNNSSTRFKIDSSGHFLPNADSTYDIGTNSVRVRNFYADTLYGDGSNLTGITQTTINSNTNNYLITGTGTANTLQGEANLTFTGQTLTAHMTTQDPAVFVGDSNRTGAGQHLAEYRGYWDGNHIGRIVFAAGDDTTNKDDGIIKFHTTPSGGGITERLRIDSEGRVQIAGQNAIAATSLTHRLLVRSQNTSDAIAIAGRNGDHIGELSFYQSDASTKIGEIEGHSTHLGFVSRAGYIQFATGGTSERMRLTSSGQLLIGTTSTSGVSSGSDDLVIGSIGDSTVRGITLATTSSAAIRWADAGDNAMGRISYSNSTDYMTLHTSNATRLTIADNGRIKIGSGTPKAQLDIKQVGNSWEDALLIQHDNANTGWNIHAERTNSALWIGYNSNTGAALADQSAAQVIHINSNKTVSLITSQSTYELTIGGLSGGPSLFLRDSGSTGTSRILFGSSGGALDGAVTYKTDSNYLSFYTNGTEHVRINQSGHLIPISDASRDLGTSSLRWRNVYTTDLQLSNENTGGNEVDGTEGNWTLQEGESDVYMINRKTGKKYKMMLQEVD